MLEVRLLGRFDVRLDGQSIEIASRLAQSLLAYLVLNPGAAHRREQLAGLLWPDASESHARGSLRQALWLIRQAIERQRPYLIADKLTVAFDPTSGFWLDAAVLDREVGEQWTPDDLIAALSVYGGELLPGFYDDWVVLERERLRAVFERKMQLLIDRLVEEGRWPDVLAWGERWIAHGQVPEAAYRALMIAHGSLGNLASVAAVYARCVEALRAELGVEPSEQTRAVYERIIRSEQPADQLGGATLPESARRALEELSQAHIGVRPRRDLGEAPLRRAAPPHNLPLQPTPFIGRERELTQIAQLLSDPACRLLSLIGLGGCGKTRLAIQAASEQVGAFRDGVCFVPLAPVSSAEFIIPAVVDALTLSLHGQADPKTQLLNYLRDTEMLVVLDNFEHLLSPVNGGDAGGGSLLADMLAAAPAVKIIVTSRERLNLRWEWALDIGGMGVPEHEQAEGLEGYSAVQLFVRSAQRVLSRFALSDRDRPHVIRICRLVEGMPLGIELAAAWTRTLSCQAIAGEIERSLDFLATSLRDVPVRQRSLRATFDYTWRLLSAEERAVFRRLSVFRGGFRREAAERVAAASAPLLSTLADKSLLRTSLSGRYDIHEVLRQYAEEKLEETPGEDDTVRDRLSEYYAAFLHQREGHLKGSRQREALEQIGEEIENVRLAWRWAVRHAHAADMARCLESLYLFYEIQGWFQEGEEALRQAVDKMGGLPDDAGPERSELFWRIAARQGRLCHRLGLKHKAGELLEKSLSAFRRLNARSEMGLVLRTLGYAAHMQGDSTRGRHLLQDSLAIARQIGDEWGAMWAFIDLSDLLTDLGEHAAARQLLEECLALCKKVGNQWGTAHSLDELGLVALASGDYVEARRLFEESLAILKEIDERWGIAIVINDLGLVATKIGEHAEAKRLLDESLATFRQIGDREGMVFSLINLSTALLMLGQHAEAKQLLQESLDRCSEAGDRLGMARSLKNLGLVALATADDSEAARIFPEALKTAMDIQALPVALDVLAEMASLARRAGDDRHALELLALVGHHPASSRETKDRAQRFLAELAAQLPADVVHAAEEQSKARQLAEVVAVVLGT